jgi:hypothetical protein
MRVAALHKGHAQEAECDVVVVDVHTPQLQLDG